MAKDFRGQDLRGRSFKNQDLTGADFSDCDLRNFHFPKAANLTGAKFCWARMGRRPLTKIFTIIFSRIIFAITISCLAAIGNLIFFLFFAENILEKLTIYSTDENKLILIICSELLYVAVIIILVNINRLSILANWSGVLIIAVCNFFTNSGFTYSVGNPLVKAIVGTMVLIGLATSTVIGAAILAEAEDGLALILIVIIAAALSKHGAESIVEIITRMGYEIKFTDPLIAKVEFEYMISLASFILMILGIYLGRRAIKKEETQLGYLRRLILKHICPVSGFTSFHFAILKNVDFSNANLKYADFKNAYIFGCCFRNAKNHHLALTDGTPLALRKVRDLVIDGIITDKNFSTLDLHGLDFSNLNLQGIDFSHADLSGANLSHTQMTGVILEGWNIDTETRLDDIECRYYYYLENGEKKRMPPEGEEYKAGEFTRIFQKIANAIDFIANDEMEVAAIKLSVEQVREESGNNEIKVQTVEEKEGFSVVKVSVPKTEDRGILYQKVKSLKQDYKTKIQVSIAEDRVRVEDNQSQISYLKEQLEKQREQLDKQREDFLAKIKSKILIKNSTIINDGVINLGEVNGDISQH